MEGWCGEGDRRARRLTAAALCVADRWPRIGANLGHVREWMGASESARKGGREVKWTYGTRGPRWTGLQNGGEERTCDTILVLWCSGGEERTKRESERKKKLA